MDAKEALEISKAARGVSTGKALRRLHGAIKVIAAQKRKSIRVNCDQMSAGVRAATRTKLISEGFVVATSADPDVSDRVWFEISW